MSPEPGPGIPRRLPGPLPPGMNNRRFGELIGWGSSDAAAIARIGRVDVQAVKAAGVTREMIDAWRIGYLNEVERNPANPSARGWAALMEHILAIWEGE